MVKVGFLLSGLHRAYMYADFMQIWKKKKTKDVPLGRCSLVVHNLMSGHHLGATKRGAFSQADTAFHQEAWFRG